MRFFYNLTVNNNNFLGGFIFSKTFHVHNLKALQYNHKHDIVKKKGIFFMTE